MFLFRRVEQSAGYNGLSSQLVHIINLLQITHQLILEIIGTGRRSLFHNVFDKNCVRILNIRIYNFVQCYRKKSQERNVRRVVVVGCRNAIMCILDLRYNDTIV